jgi:hypothetical protein
MLGQTVPPPPRIATGILMIVIKRNGKAIVVTGWRVWVIAAVAVVAAAGVLAVVAFLVLGIAVSIVAFLLIVIPAIAVVALVASFLRPRKA